MSMLLPLVGSRGDGDMGMSWLMAADVDTDCWEDDETLPETRRGDEEADKERKGSRTAYQAGSDPRGTHPERARRKEKK